MTRLRRRSLRNRLALLYAALVGLAVMAVLVAVYFVARHDQVSQLDGDARLAAAALATEARHLGPSERFPRMLEPRSALETGQLLAVIDQGRVIAPNETARRLANAASGAGLVAPGKTGTVEVSDHGFRVASAAAGSGRTAVAAVPFSGALEARESLLTAVIVAGGLGILLTALGAWFAARRTLRPLMDIAETAVRVAPDDLSHRTGAEPLDEIGEVGAAVDRMLQRLEEAFAVQRRFLQDASHELRTPLTVARGHLEVLAAERDPDREELQATTAIVLEELETMGRLVDGLLELAWASEPGELRLEPLDAGEVLGRLVRDFQVVARRDWRLDVAESAPLHGDRQAVHRIVSNLVRNAVEHSEEGSAIEVAATRVNGGVDISVRDYGSGIDPTMRDKLFERFVHGSSGGFGLGLAIADTLARRQGGSVRHEAPEGRGARFVVHLPSGEAP
jgi:signal transduction histidine kinase